MDNLNVECYSGYRGEETPRRFWMASRCIAVHRIIDRWLAPDHRYFKILGGDGHTYILRNDTRTLKWELIYYNQSPPPQFRSRSTGIDDD